MVVSNSAEGSLVRSLDRGLLILDALIANGVQSLGQISTAADLPKSTTHRLLMTLQARGYVVPVDGEPGSYRLGVKGTWFTSARKSIHHHLARLQAQTGETVNFGVVVGSEVEYVDRVLSDHALRWGVDIGSRVPLYCSGMGKAVLAYSQDVAQEQLAFVKKTRNTIADYESLQVQLEIIRDQGYAVDDEEFIDGVVCIAAPVRMSGAIIGAVSISGPAVRFPVSVAVECTPLLQVAGEKISAAISGDIHSPWADA